MVGANDAESAIDLSCDEDLMVLAMLNDHIIPQLTVATMKDILAELLQKECDHRPDVTYICTVQRDGMEASWRVRIAEWMVAISTEFEFATVTTDLALNYLDRHLSRRSVSQHNLQLVGLVALLVASKFHEPDALLVAEAANLAHLAGFTPDTIRSMETSMLDVLEWNLHIVVPIHFVECFVVELSPDDSSRLGEACLPFLAASRMSHEMLAFLPSEIAVAIVTLACQVTGHHASCASVIASLTQLVPATTTAKVERCLQILAQCIDMASTTLSLKRDRSPSPLGVEGLVLGECADDHQSTFCPLVKRPKCHL
ncbi:hypothetical protein H310_12230 [Aphanomyces invadans]|uniref:Cyclin-like domain-containing protein n=1 Tax=Aphanomyces invadans TaxID=157072 RepID=A0A024TIC8_9STRA|nr:hypothetical protein H310_12230 [Aphanomyces invadans]ETV93885.1 hypothetical protein H310_12230 [Aphanomyces invadans]|eukprot:XP_008877445.1 hypothetical protein H310_12230 [Aphanomyces invadans]